MMKDPVSQTDAVTQNELDHQVLYKLTGEGAMRTRRHKNIMIEMIGTLTSANMFVMSPLTFVACLPSKADLMPAWLLKVRSSYQRVIQH